MKKYVTIGKHISVSYLTYFIIFLANPLLTVLLTRFLPVADYGIYALLSVTISVSVVLLNVGFTDYIQTTLPGTHKRHRIGVFFTLFLFQAVLVITLACLLFVPQLRGLVLGVLRLHGYLPELLLAVGIIIVNSLLRIFHAYLFAGQRIILMNILTCFQQTAWIVAVGLWVLGTNTLALRVVMTLFFLGTLVSGILGIGVLWRELRTFFRIGIQAACVRHALVFGIPLLVMTASAWAMDIGNRYLINYFLGKEQVALFSLAYSLLGVVFSLSALLPSTLYPYLAEAWNKKGNYQAFFNMAVKYTLLIAVPSIFGFAVLRKEIVTLISGDAYLAAATVIPVLSFYPLAAAFNYLLGQLLLLRRKTAKLAGIYVIGGIVNIALNGLLIPRMGIVGAAWATLISYVLVFFILLWDLRRTLNVSFDFVRFWRIFFAALLMAVALFFVKPQVFWTKILTILGGAALYGVLILFFKVLDQKELAVAKKLLRLPAWLGLFIAQPRK